jgi:hypothetical protein
MALLVLINFLLVVFDMTYIPLRDFWLQGRFQVTLLRFDKPIALGPIRFREVKFPPKEPWNFPLVTEVAKYDEVKGIKPYRATTAYLQTVDELERAIALPPSPETTREINKLLAKLRQDSVTMVDTNPFQIANKTGTLEKIKNLLRERIFGTENASAKDAFQTFWSREYLERTGFEENLQFFDRQLRPLIETNYYRPVGENGLPIDNFEAIDFLFGIVFFTEFLARTWWISRSHAGLRWFEAMLWRWYDVFLFIPVYRWLRIIPTVIRLEKAHLINLETVRVQTVRGFVAMISEEITENIVVRVIDQMQRYIRRGEVRNFLNHHTNREFIDLNDTNEIGEIVKLMITVTVDKVLPRIQPEVEAFLRHNIDKAMMNSSVYSSLQSLPMMKDIQARLTLQISSQLYTAFTEMAKDMTKEDLVSEKLLEKLIESFGQTMGTELQSLHSMDRLENLLIALLEEFKVNYVQDIVREDIEIVLEKSRGIQRKTNNIARLSSSRYRRDS